MMDSITVILLTQIRYVLIAIFFASLVGVPAVNCEELIATGQWRQDKGKRTLHISFSDLIGAKRKNLIQSGFSTYTHLVITFGVSSQSSALQVDCSVKYDTWNERYHVVRMGNSSEQSSVNNFETYSDTCLSIDIANPEVINQLVSSERIVGELSMRQLSAQQAEKIRNWLVTQQSGFMQNLFSHMLGDVTLSENLVAKIKIVPESGSKK
jgi:hypothetical protein